MIIWEKGQKNATMRVSTFFGFVVWDSHTMADIASIKKKLEGIKVLLYFILPSCSFITIYWLFFYLFFKK